MSYSGEVAVVTGGGAGGIGEAISRRLAAEGLRVVVADLDESKGKATVAALEADGHEALFLPVDIAVPESAAELAAQAAARFGRIDYLVNNAALFGGMPRGGLIDMEWGELMRLFSINLFGGLAVARAVVPHIRAAGRGAMVWTSSTAAWLGAGHYGVAKAGVNALVLSLARELGPDNIRVNAIAPGATDTAAMHRQTRPEYLEQRLTQLAIPRLGTPKDQADAVAFLLSDQASFITGQILAVDGGSLFARL